MLKIDTVMNKESETSDEKIIESIQNGDKDAYGLIMDRYTDKMTRYAKRYFRDINDVEDMVQDVFVKAYININSFKLDMRFSPWIYRIAHNIFINKIAWKSIRNLVSLDTDEFLPQTLRSDENVERQAIREEEKEIIEKHIKNLDEKYKTPIILFYFEDMSYEEISEIMQIPINTVGIRIKRGKDKLKIILANKI